MAGGSRVEADSSSSAPEGRQRQGAEPEGEREGRESDDPAGRVAAGARDRGDGEEDERGREPAEERSERAPLHARSVLEVEPK